MDKKDRSIPKDVIAFSDKLLDQNKVLFNINIKKLKILVNWSVK
jgi:hypothetical protein